MIEVSKDTRFGNTKALLLFENPEDALKIRRRSRNQGSKRWFNGSLVGKVVVSKVLSIDEKTLIHLKN